MASPFDPVSESRSPFEALGPESHYRVLREIARGGMGAVAEATHVHTGREVAMKMVLTEWCDRADVNARLAREARVLGDVTHPNIVEVLDANMDVPGRGYLVMEKLVGRTVEGLLLSRPTLPVPEVVAIARGMVEALDCVHEAGYVHRDIKPGNVFLSRDRHRGDVVKLIDFGVAMVISQAPSGRADALTRPGEMVGTPAYMPAEQLSASPVDARVDVYALAATLYECLSGRLPRGAEMSEIVDGFMSGRRPVPIRQLCPEVPTPFAELIDAGLSVSREKRPVLSAFRTVLQALAAEEAAQAQAAKNAATGDAPLPLWRRRNPRFAFVTRVLARLSDGTLLAGGTEEMSSQGVQLRLPATHPVTGTVHLHIDLPGGPLAIYGEVRWSRAAARWQVVGVALAEEPTGRLAAYVEHLARRYAGAADPT